MRCRLITHRVAKSSARHLTKQRLPAGTESSFAAWLSIRIAKRSRRYCQCKGSPAGHQAFPHQHASSPMPVQAPGQKAPGPDHLTYDFDRSLIVQRLRLLVPVRTMMHAPLVGVGLVSGESHSWGTLAARRFAETIASRRGVVALRSSQKSRVRTEMISFHARAPMGPCDPVRAHILNHNGAAGRIKLTPVLQQTDKHFVAIWNSTPAHPECIADTGVSLLGRFGNSRRAQEGTRQDDCYCGELFHRLPIVRSAHPSPA